MSKQLTGCEPFSPYDSRSHSMKDFLEAVSVSSMPVATSSSFLLVEDLMPYKSSRVKKRVQGSSTSSKSAVETGRKALEIAYIRRFRRRVVAGWAFFTSPSRCKSEEVSTISTFASLSLNSTFSSEYSLLSTRGLFALINSTVFEDRFSYDGFTCY